MIIDKYTKHSIFSLPQIFYETLTKYDLKNNDFVNMYTSDLNHPLLSNHIFLVFHNIKNYLEERLKKHILYYCNYDITMYGIRYSVFVFNRAYSIHRIVNKIDLGLYDRLSYEDKLKILTFWNLPVDSKVHSYLFNPLIKTKKPIGENITLQDINKKPYQHYTDRVYYLSPKKFLGLEVKYRNHIIVVFHLRSRISSFPYTS